MLAFEGRRMYNETEKAKKEGLKTVSFAPWGMLRFPCRICRNKVNKCKQNPSVKRSAEGLFVGRGAESEKSIAVFGDKAFNCLKGFIGNNMLDFAGILCGDSGGNTELCEYFC